MDLSLNELVMGVLLGSLLLVITASIFSRLLHNRVEKSLIRQRCECRLCGTVFMNAGGGKVISCPSCDALNLTKGNGKMG